MEAYSNCRGYMIVWNWVTFKKTNFHWIWITMEESLVQWTPSWIAYRCSCYDPIHTDPVGGFDSDKYSAGNWVSHEQEILLRNAILLYWILVFWHFRLARYGKCHGANILSPHLYGTIWCESEWVFVFSLFYDHARIFFLNSFYVYWKANHFPSVMVC